jgi:glycosyltransferase involved in cell wall biosynthesis
VSDLPTGPAGVVVVTMLYRPEPNFITADVAERLRAKGPVTVVTAHPNYPLGRFYPGVRRPWLPRRSVENGVTVWRVPLVPDHSNSKLRRLISYLSFTISAMLIAPFVGGRPHTVWVYQTPFTSALAALWFKLRYRSRLVYTCADLWPESFGATGVMRSDAGAMRLLFGYSRWINRFADAIICSTRSTLERYAADGVPRERLAYVPVWVDGAPRSEAPLPAAEEESPPTVVYAGNLGPAQALDTVVRAAAELERRGRRVRFALYGSGSSEPELRALAAGLGATNVSFPGRIEPEETFRVCAGAFAQLVSLRPTPLFRMTVPSKLAFSFAAGAPVLYGLEGEAAAVAAESGGALPYTAEDPGSLVAAVESLLATAPEERRQMRARLQRYFHENFAPEALLNRYEELMSEPSPRPLGRPGAARAAVRTEG